MIARRHDVTVEHLTRGKHSEKVRLISPGGEVETMGLPSSPRDAAWSVLVAKKQAKAHCEFLLRRDATPYEPPL